MSVVVYRKVRDFGYMNETCLFGCMSDLATSRLSTTGFFTETVHGSGGNLEGSLYTIYIQSHACYAETQTGDMNDSVFCTRLYSVIKERLY